MRPVGERWETRSKRLLFPRFGLLYPLHMAGDRIVGLPGALCIIFRRSWLRMAGEEGWMEVTHGPTLFSWYKLAEMLNRQLWGRSEV